MLLHACDYLNRINSPLSLKIIEISHGGIFLLLQHPLRPSLHTVSYRFPVTAFSLHSEQETLRDLWEAEFFCDYVNHGNHYAFSLPSPPSPDGRCLEIWVKRPKTRVCRILKCKSTACAHKGSFRNWALLLASVPEDHRGKQKLLFRPTPGWCGSCRASRSRSPTASVWPSDVFYLPLGYLKTFFFFLADI